jgi:hypothetical protein
MWTVTSLLAAPAISNWSILFPFGAFFVPLIVVFAVGAKIRSRATTVLVASKSWRITFKIVFAAIVPGLIGFFLEAAGVSEAFESGLTTKTTACLSVVCFLTSFFLVGQFTDYVLEREWEAELEKLRSKVEKEKLLRDEARVHRDFLSLLEKVFCEAMASRLERFTKLPPFDAVDVLDYLLAIRSALAPQEQVARLTLAVHELFKQRIQSDHLAENPTLRVTLFFCDPSTRNLSVRYAWDGLSENCVTTALENHSDKFSLDKGTTECLAAWAAVKGKIGIVPDAEAADKDENHPFHFFSIKQRTAIRSILAIPLVGLGQNLPAEFVLSIDTNIKNFFQTDRLQQYEALSKGLALRLLTESRIESALPLPPNGAN